jgi:ABC-type Co2+ transport system permease subunit
MYNWMRMKVECRLPSSLVFWFERSRCQIVHLNVANVALVQFRLGPQQALEQVLQARVLILFMLDAQDGCVELACNLLSMGLLQKVGEWTVFRLLKRQQCQCALQFVEYFWVCTFA